MKMTILHVFLKGVLVILISLIGSSALAQEADFSAHGIKLGFGLGASMGARMEGVGLNYSIGYQKDVWKDRLRFNPNFSIGHYSARFVEDSRDEFFNVINIEANMYYDLIRFESFSLLVGTGAWGNMQFGLQGTGGDPDMVVRPQSSEYGRDFRFGVAAIGGFRIANPWRRTGLNIILINLHRGNKDYLESHVKVELDIKF